MSNGQQQQYSGLSRFPSHLLPQEHGYLPPPPPVPGQLPLIFPDPASTGYAPPGSLAEQNMPTSGAFFGTSTTSNSQQPENFTQVSGRHIGMLMGDNDSPQNLATNPADRITNGVTSVANASGNSNPLYTNAQDDQMQRRLAATVGQLQLEAWQQQQRAALASLRSDGEQSQPVQAPRAHESNLTQMQTPQQSSDHPMLAALGHDQQDPRVFAAIMQEQQQMVLAALLQHQHQQQSTPGETQPEQTRTERMPVTAHQQIHQSVPMYSQQHQTAFQPNTPATAANTAAPVAVSTPAPQQNVQAEAARVPQYRVSEGLRSQLRLNQKYMVYGNMCLWNGEQFIPINLLKDVDADRLPGGVILVPDAEVTEEKDRPAPPPAPTAPPTGPKKQWKRRVSKKSADKPPPVTQMTNTTTPLPDPNIQPQQPPQPEPMQSFPRVERPKPVLPPPETHKLIEGPDTEKQFVVCKNCGYLGKNLTVCEGCSKILPPDVKLYIKKPVPPKPPPRQHPPKPSPVANGVRGIPPRGRGLMVPRGRGTPVRGSPGRGAPGRGTPGPPGRGGITRGGASGPQPRFRPPSPGRLTRSARSRGKPPGRGGPPTRGASRSAPPPPKRPRRKAAEVTVVLTSSESSDSDVPEVMPKRRRSARKPPTPRSASTATPAKPKPKPKPKTPAKRRRRRKKLSDSDEDGAPLVTLTQTPTEPTSRVLRSSRRSTSTSGGASLPGHLELATVAVRLGTQFVTPSKAITVTADGLRIPVSHTVKVTKKVPKNSNKEQESKSTEDNDKKDSETKEDETKMDVDNTNVTPNEEKPNTTQPSSVEEEVKVNELKSEEKTQDSKPTDEVDYDLTEVEEHKEVILDVLPREAECVLLCETKPCCMFLYVTNDCAVRMRKALDMTEGSPQYFDPSSEDLEQKRVMLMFPDPLPITSYELLAIHARRTLCSRLLEREVSLSDATEPGVYEISSNLARYLLVTSTSSDTEFITSHRLGAVDVTLAQQHVLELETRLSIGAWQKVFGQPLRDLFVYPFPPLTSAVNGREAVTMTNHDLWCLREYEQLSDVMIDFYLKYLLYERLSEAMRDRVHVFSTSFYKRMMIRPSRKGADYGAEAKLTAAEKKHYRVSQLTKNVDLFEKDFVLVPINDNSHWYLAVICYPGLVPSNYTAPKRGRPFKIDRTANHKPEPTDLPEESTSDAASKLEAVAAALEKLIESDRETAEPSTKPTNDPPTGSQTKSTEMASGSQVSSDQAAGNQPSSAEVDASNLAVSSEITTEDPSEELEKTQDAEMEIDKQTDVKPNEAGDKAQVADLQTTEPVVSEPSESTGKPAVSESMETSVDAAGTETVTESQETSNPIDAEVATSKQLEAKETTASDTKSVEAIEQGDEPDTHSGATGTLELTSEVTEETSAVGAEPMDTDEVSQLDGVFDGSDDEQLTPDSPTKQDATETLQSVPETLHTSDPTNQGAVQSVDDKPTPEQDSEKPSEADQQAGSVQPATQDSGDVQGETQASGDIQGDQRALDTSSTETQNTTAPTSQAAEDESSEHQSEESSKPADEDSSKPVHEETSKPADDETPKSGDDDTPKPADDETSKPVDEETPKSDDETPKFTARRSARAKIDVFADSPSQPTNQPCILVFDSLSNPQQHKFVIRTLREYVQCEWVSRGMKPKQRVFNKHSMQGYAPQVPQQKNLADCGLYVLQYAESFFEDVNTGQFRFPVEDKEDWFSQRQIADKRAELRELIFSKEKDYHSLPVDVRCTPQQTDDASETPRSKQNSPDPPASGLAKIEADLAVDTVGEQCSNTDNLLQDASEHSNFNEVDQQPSQTLDESTSEPLAEQPSPEQTAETQQMGIAPADPAPEPASQQPATEPVVDTKTDS